MTDGQSSPQRLLLTRQLPGIRHRVIGLVSGGKDSCFNLMHVKANGHEIVALATLTPAEGIDELDSYMYQSVGTTVPPLIAKAMDLPHFTRVIEGKSVVQGAEYGSREHGGGDSGEKGDETEDLTALLLDVLARHPDATAVASGAILSNYQRLRIEHVCQRLGLTSLAYLWQSEQLPLVNRMISSGLEAVLVKVAGAGLGERQVGKTLGQLLPLLTKLQMMYGAHPAGEGGEYETLTLDCPLFSHRIKFVESEIVVTDPEPNCVAYLRVKKAVLAPKPDWTRPSVQELRMLLELEDDSDGLDEQGRELFEDVADMQSIPEAQSPSTSDAAHQMSLKRRGQHIGRVGRWFGVMAEGETLPGQSVGDELSGAMERIKELLAARQLSLPLHAAHITLLLSSMSLFPAANEAYVKYFGTSPPSRATVAVPLPEGQRIRIEVVGFDNSGNDNANDTRLALHVQGLSYWAPANIGPYSQAVLADARLHIAGQIPLLPPSLTFAAYPSPPRSPYAQQATLALQHVRKITEVLRDPNSTGGGWTGWVESCVGWWAKPAGCGVEGPNVAQKAWKAWATENGCPRAPVVFVRASELPRGALVEYQVNVHTGREGFEPASATDDDDDDWDEPTFEAVYAHGQSGAPWEACIAPKGRKGSRAVVFLSDAAQMLAPDAVIEKVLSHAVTIRAYHTVNADPSLNPLIKQAEKNGACWTGVPVLDIRDRNGNPYNLALEIFAA